MRSALTFLLLAAASVLAVPASSAQTVNPQTGAVCEPQPTDMESVRSKAETGDASAEYEMGRSMLSPRPADSELGVFYERGRDDIEHNYPAAFRWLSTAAKHGQPDAQVTLGQMYENGEGVPQDYGLAAYWYRKAADHTINLGGAGVGNNSLASYIRADIRPRRATSLYIWVTRICKMRTE